ncbi:MAG: hydrogenase maturation nickel metallochaperone HypA [Deltaproteobacteria bacterium]|nr:hydrogenase maturation nickel metallochaperone HypA [Deltaproteobacteria bacterium]
MHELQVTQRILDIVLRHAQANGVNKIISIQLKIGELSDLENEWVQKYFDHLSKDTIAKNAKLKIERTPVVMKCDDCEHSFEINIKEIKDIQCPLCAHKKCTLISGREYYIKDMEVI